MAFTDDILARGLELGFDRVAALPWPHPRTGEHFTAWLAAGYHGEMAYLAERVALRLAPAALAPGAQSLLVAVLNYNPPPLAPVADRSHARIARYALTPDYHERAKAALYALDAFIRGRTGRTTLGKAVVDTAPVLERDLAAQAGLGFSGRNTLLITPGLGSWTFIAGLFVPEALGPGLASATAARAATVAARAAAPAAPTCGRCTRCLTACPTAAFVAPHVLDARRCISYLTIEHRGPIPPALRGLMGAWVFGCDVCQEVCPYNRAAPVADAPPADLSLAAPPLAELLGLDEAGFRARFRGTPVRRAKRRGLVRNACVAAGNSGDRGLIPALGRLLADAEPLVRGHAAWALGRLGGPAAHQALRGALARETDGAVRAELNDAAAAVEGTVA